jgi:glycosyltransferase involved in cell wall biosynthesis
MSAFNMLRNPRLSIVVCTFQRADHLARLLDTLQRQTASYKDFEIIIVDNEITANSDVQELCSSPQYMGLSPVYVHHSTLGVSSARNRGAMEARAEYIAFLDDDMLIPPNWVKQVFSIHIITNPMVYGGPYKPSYTSTPPKWFKDKYASINFGDEAHWLDKSKSLPGGNCIWNRDLFMRLGGFSENFGYVGSKKRYGEDNDLCQRASQVGIRLWYDPSIFVLHHIEEQRMSVHWMMTTIVHHSQVKAHIVLKETRLVDTRPVYRQILSISKKFVLQMIRFFRACLQAPFWKRKGYPYKQNYIIEVIGPELRQVSLLFEMFYCLVFNSRVIRVGLR